jgi:hypothetical protein
VTERNFLKQIVDEVTSVLNPDPIAKMEMSIGERTVKNGFELTASNINGIAASIINTATLKCIKSLMKS